MDKVNSSMIATTALEPSHWPLYRDLRLQSLQDSPDAFGSTYGSEATRTDEDWSARLQAAASSGQGRAFVALEGEAPCGLVWCKLAGAGPGVAEIFQMWVDPACRGRGAGRALLRAALDWARRHDMQRVRLGVTIQDSPAMHLYTALGFKPIGPPEPLRAGSALMSQGMELVLDTVQARND